VSIVQEMMNSIVKAYGGQMDGRTKFLFTHSLEILVRAAKAEAATAQEMEVSAEIRQKIEALKNVVTREVY
jgi:hypothetical protein